MRFSVFDIFKIGIGPSSSHTVGPMKAARAFAMLLAEQGLLAQTAQVECVLYGSLGATGRGHASDTAVLLGLSGFAPEEIDPDQIPAAIEAIETEKSLPLLGGHRISFRRNRDIKFLLRQLPAHPNGMTLSAFAPGGDLLFKETFYSIGGGFVRTEAEMDADEEKDGETAVPYAFTSAAELLALCDEFELGIHELMLANERSRWGRAEIEARLWHIWTVMDGCIQRGCRVEGVLPGGLQITRRAPALYRRLREGSEATLRDPLNILDFVNVYALAVNEENAAGGRVVTAPTNGAAGIIPAVLRYWLRFGLPEDAFLQRQAVTRFLLAAGAIGMLYKRNASISGADVGCQGEVGVACSMAAAGLTAVRGGSPAQIENAAEIGMEHNLGLTCDPIGGLVQIPCIERNAMGAIKAINAARIALRGDGRHHVSLDKVIQTMRETGRDMKNKYKETSLGGLAVNLTEC
jgi:L-serine dehydratase